MVADFDSVRQAELWSTLGPYSTISELKSCLRVADLIVGDTVLTARQVLDGVFFLFLGVGGVRDILGCDAGAELPVLVSRLESEGTVGAVLENLNNKHDFLWSSTPLLRELGWSAERIAAARAEWVRACDHGLVRHITVDGHSLGQLWEPLAATMKSPFPRGSAEDDDIRNLKRSAAFSTIATLESTRGPEYCAAMRQAYSSRYNLAIARQHQADLLELGTTSAAEMGVEATSQRPHLEKNLDRNVADTPLSISGSIVETVRNMPSARYATVSRQTRTAKDQWTHGKHVNAIRNVAFAVHRNADGYNETRGHAIWSGLWRICVAAGGGVLGFLSDFGTGRSAAIILAVTVLVMTLPWGDIADLWRIRSTSMDAVIRLGGMSEHAKS
ncbi:MAG: hypothetical protein LBH13_07900 [Cellulomonadaceae bacterium]|nr:hypothetical protein [Cellulomonadaceae bacterium]